MELNEIVNALQGKPNKKDKVLGAFNDLLANFEGPEGPQGEKGDVGPIGPKGDKGDTGPAGPKGLDGKIGPRGRDGKDGKDAKPLTLTATDIKKIAAKVEVKEVESTVTAKDVIEEIKKLKGNDRIDISNIRNGEFLASIANKKKIDTSDLRWHGSGATAFIQLTDVPQSYTGQGGKLVSVKADGSGLEFISSAAIPAPGLDTQVIYNDGGVLNGDSGMVYNDTTNTMTVDNILVNSDLTVNGNFTFGNASTDALTVNGDATFLAAFQLSKYSDDAVGANLSTAKYRGTLVSPTVITTGDELSRLEAKGYDGTNAKIGGYAQFASYGTIATNRIPTYFNIFLSPDVTTGEAPTLVAQFYNPNKNSRHYFTFASADSNTDLIMSVAGAATDRGIAINPKGNGKISITGTLSQTSGVQGLLELNPTMAVASGTATLRGLRIISVVNNSGANTGNFTDIMVNTTNTNLAGATHNFLDLQISSVSKLSVDTTGSITLSGNVVGNSTNSVFYATKFTSGGGANNSTVTLQSGTGFSTANRNMVDIATGNFATLSGTQSAVNIPTTITPSDIGSGSFNILNASYVIDATAGAQSGTVSGLYIKGTETSLNGFTHRLINVYGGAAGTTNLFYVTQTGVTYSSGGFIATNYNSTGSSTMLTINNRDFATANRFAVAMVTGTFTNTTGSNGAVKITPEYNQATGDAANTDLLINRNQIAVGSGAQYLIDAQVTNVSKFSVDNVGAVVMAGALTINGATLTTADAFSFVFGTTTGVKIGTSTSQKIGFYNATPIVQGAAVADATGGATVDAEARTAINALISRIEATGLIATV